MTTNGSPSKPDTIVLIHGLWLTARSWEDWKERFEGRGYQVLTPAWPRMEGDVEDIRRNRSALDGLGVTEIVDHYDGIIRQLDRPPVIMGHSTGGLVTELLLDRGLGAAGVAISPVQIKGVLRLAPSQLRVVLPALANPAIRKRTIELSPKQFHYGFTNTMGDDESKAAYDRYAVPGPGRIVYEGAFANFSPRAATKVDVHKDDRPPLLVIGNSEDHTVPAPLSRAAAKRMAKSKAVVDYKEFMGRPHFTGGAPGWEAVADYALEWAEKQVAPEARKAARVEA